MAAAEAVPPALRPAAAEGAVPLWRLMDYMRPKLASETVNGAIARVAGRQHGVLTQGQLVRAGLAPRAISHRAASGKLFRVYRGVYAVGHAGLSNEGRWMAAVLACGAGAVLSHRSAAELLELLKPLTLPIHVTVAGAG